jgi:branched-chain amino acid transport system substrate-binding protein
LLGVAAVGLGLAAAAMAQAADPVRIGFSIAKTGLFAAAAPSQLNAYELWKDQVNAAGGLDVKGEKRPVELVFYDDQSDPGKAVRIYEKLITDDKVDLLLAPWGTPHHIAVAGVLLRYKFPMVGNSAASVQVRKIDPGYIWFPTAEIPDRLAQAIADALVANGFKSVAVLTNALPFSMEIKGFLMPALQKAGIEVKVNEDYPPDIKDMTAVLTKVKAAAPDAVLSLSYPGDSGLYMKQARELGIAAPFQLVLVGPTMDWFLKAFGPAADGIVTMGHWTPNRKEWPKAQAFFEAYVKKFGERPDFLDSELAYMSCEILQQAVAKAGLDHEALRKAIAEGTFDTINGEVKFQGVENMVTPTSLLQIQGDQLQLIWPKDIATAPFKPKPAWPK